MSARKSINDTLLRNLGLSAKLELGSGDLARRIEVKKGLLLSSEDK